MFYHFDKDFAMRFSVARSAFTIAAAAGAVFIICNQCLVLSLGPSGIVGPAARHFECFVCFVVKICVFSVFSGLKFRDFSCLSWLIKIDMLLARVAGLTSRERRHASFSSPPDSPA